MRGRNDTNDGGQAFPVPPDTSTPVIKGMSLRDYFAAAALNGMIASQRICVDHADAARDAYCYADAMITERNRK